jgi:tape measure domain-containing protein
MNSQKFAANSLRNSVRNLGAAYASVFVAIEGAKAFFNTGKEFDSINASLLAASGSYAQAGKDFEFIKDISLGLGIGLKDVATGFAKIGAAGRASGLSTGVIQESFSDISKTVRAFGLSQDRASLVFLGFQQILSKGVVSMQELRQQIGEQLPTAIPIAKKALKEMGSSFTNLDDAVKSGTLSAKEFVPVFARLLRQDVESSGALEASLNTITAAQQRFTSTLDLLTIRSFQAGAKTGLVSFFDNVAMAAENLAPLFRVIGKVVNVVATGLGGLLRVVTILISPLLIITDVLTNLWGVFSDGTKDVDQSAGFFDATIDGMIAKIKSLVGWLLVPLGAIEALSLAFESLSDKFDFTTFGGIAKAATLAPQLAGRKALESFGVTFDKPFLPEKSESTTSTVNSGNTITVSIDAAGSNPDELRTALDEWSQEMFGAAVPSS